MHIFANSAQFHKLWPTVWVVSNVDFLVKFSTFGELSSEESKPMMEASGRHWKLAKRCVTQFLCGCRSSTRATVLRFLSTRMWCVAFGYARATRTSVCNYSNYHSYSLVGVPQLLLFAIVWFCQNVKKLPIPLWIRRWLFFPLKMSMYKVLTFAYQIFSRTTLCSIDGRITLPTTSILRKLAQKTLLF